MSFRFTGRAAALIATGIILFLSSAVISVEDGGDARTPVDKLRTLRGDEYKKARDAFLGLPDAKDTLAKTVAGDKSDWLAYALQVRLTDPALAKAADTWKLPDSFTAKTSGLQTDLLQVKPLAELKFKCFEGDPRFGPTMDLPGYHFTPYFSLMLERLVQNTENNSDAFRCWTLFNALATTPMSEKESERLTFCNPRALGKDTIDTQLIQGWLAALVKNQKDPVVVLMAAGRYPVPGAEEALQQFSKQDAPLGTLAGILYAGRVSGSTMSFGGHKLKGVWLENWAKEISPAQAEFLESFFTTPSLTDKMKDDAKDILKWSSYRFDEVFECPDFLIEGLLLGANEKLFHQAMKDAYTNTEYRMAEGLITSYEMGADRPDMQPPEGAWELIKAMSKRMGSHYSPAIMKKIEAIPVKSAKAKEIVAIMSAASKESKTPYYTGKEIDEMMAQTERMEAP